MADLDSGTLLMLGVWHECDALHSIELKARTKP